MSRIGNKFDTPQGWSFHNLSKGVLKRFLDSQTKDINILSDLKVEQDWLEMPPPEKGVIKEPYNVELIKNGVDEYRKQIKMGKIEVPVMYRPFYNMVIDEVLALYIQDSAYYERLGGMAMFIIQNQARWKGKDKATRDKLLVDLYNWWRQNDIRDYSKGWIDSSFVYMVRGYRNEKFFEDSITFFIDYIIRHHKQFRISPLFAPTMWFPRGRGQISWLISGRTA
jgi:hypothetical protein